MNRNLKRRGVRVASAVLGFSSLLAAAHATRAAHPAQTTCTSPAFHRLDFRLGVFDAKTSGGIPAGHDQVQAILSGCGLVEQWTGAVSGHGHGLTVYDAKQGTWHMLFVNDAGNVLHLAGKMRGTALVLIGDNYSFDGRFGLHRMSWAPLPGGGFRQHWELSTDHGHTWGDVFDGRFTPTL